MTGAAGAEYQSAARGIAGRLLQRRWLRLRLLLAYLRVLRLHRNGGEQQAAAATR